MQPDHENTKTKRLIFDYTVKGHHLEYLHHLYQQAIKDQESDYVFVVPESFKQTDDKYDWSGAANIQFDYMTAGEQKRCENGNPILSAWHKCSTLRKYTKKHSAQQVFLIMMIFFLPFLPFRLPKGTQARGIIYRIYLYEWKSLGWSKRIQDILKFWLMARSRKIETVFVLNDQAAANYYNRRFKTDKFAFVPDPISDTDSEPYNLRKELGISRDRQLNIHFGGLSRRKGTLAILDAIGLMSPEELQTQSFVFAGRIYPDIKDEFYAAYDKLKEKGCDIRVYDEFCSYEFLNCLCHSCDKILIPYSNTNQSSGVIGYAARHGKPVIGPSKGLLGKLIRNYHLGTLLPDFEPQTLKESILSVGHTCSGDDYQKNTPELFAKICLDEK